MDRHKGKYAHLHEHLSIGVQISIGIVYSDNKAWSPVIMPGRNIYTRCKPPCRCAECDDSLL
jgi:hypothetical protein